MSCMQCEMIDVLTSTEQLVFNQVQNLSIITFNLDIFVSTLIDLALVQFFDLIDIFGIYSVENVFNTCHGYKYVPRVSILIPFRFLSICLFSLFLIR